MKRLSKFSEKLRERNDAEEIFDLMCSFGQALGYEYAAFGQVANSPSDPMANVKHYGMVNYPPEWIEQYEAERLFFDDPVVQRGHEIDEVFKWSDLPQLVDLRPGERSVLGEAFGHGLKNGITIPLHGRSGKPGLICFAKTEGRAITAAEEAELQAIALIGFTKIDKLLVNSSAVSNLSKRQVECLYWTAMGLSSKAIGDRLDLKENTVTYHIKTAMKHLGTNNRTVAVLQCISAGAFNIS
ncbi:LuxR family transcriptional regulator [Epibacterium sp. DP7N7-1]|nr:LuxR family transcriptional regulator [Epibacterium sp. DP7N7-1]